MYDYVDRPLNHLDHGSLFMVQSMRLWVYTLSQKRCPACSLAPNFTRHGITPALIPFQTMMAILNQHALQDMSFSPCGYPQVGEHEAIMISLVVASRSYSIERMTGLLKLMITEEQSAPLHNAIDELASYLAGANMLPEYIMPLRRQKYR